jgi:hypothetical protein
MIETPKITPVIILFCSMYVSQRVWWKRDMIMSPWTDIIRIISLLDFETVPYF